MMGSDEAFIRHKMLTNELRREMRTVVENTRYSVPIKIAIIHDILRANRWLMLPPEVMDFLDDHPYERKVIHRFFDEDYHALLMKMRMTTTNKPL